MSKAKVYYTNLRTVGNRSLPEKLVHLADKAGLGRLALSDQFIAIKIHFGELGNMAYLRPNYAREMVSYLKEKGGKPFLTDCSTLYAGSRKDALEHLETAYINGYSPFSAGCHILIADGLKGDDEVLVPVPGGEFFTHAKIGRAIMDADVILTLNHFKCHELTGIGGAIKNLGMGCGSKKGKAEMHAEGKPMVISDKCIGCGACLAHCAHGAITLDNDGIAAINHDLCVGCAHCVTACSQKAVESPDDEHNQIPSKKISEYAKAVLNGRPAFHINLATDISPFCDCYANNDMPIVPDVGMFASEDPVALDTACAELCNKQPEQPGSRLSESEHRFSDHFCNTHPGTDWRISLKHAQKLGMGSMEYELIEV